MAVYKTFIKRTVDLILAALLFILFSPLFLLIALLIKLDGSGPVFFRQKRGGRGGDFFEILKFRTMKPKTSNDGKDFDPGDDVRVTGIGKILRKTKLDELPQLINVMKGEMSLVGPRPEVRKYIEIYPERWSRILSVRPGITDPASIVFRNEEEILAEADDPEKEYIEIILPRKLDLYEKYVNNITLTGDLILLVKTVLAVLRPGRASDG